MNNLILVRGLQGSGKTSFANVITKAVCSADDYFVSCVDKKYKWDANKINQAHQWCYKKCELFMKYNTKNITVANVFVEEKYLKQYFDLAAKYNYKVFSIIVENRHGNKNIHGVGDEAIIRLSKKFNIKLY